MKIRILFLLLIMPFSVIAQDSKKEKKEIEKVVLGYIENFYANDYDKMEKFLHDELSKRGINQNGKLNKNLSKEALKNLMSKKRALPARMQSNKVSAIFIDRKFASAILSTGYPKVKWKEYIHLAKFNGKWLILDVFWNFDE